MWKCRQATPIPTHDLWIASLAVEHGACSFTGQGAVGRRWPCART
ncbi:MAG: hypothetical protein V3T72_09090 [Thermoanaerobaculia bacterium]